MWEDLTKFLCLNPVPATVRDYAVVLTKETSDDAAGVGEQLTSYFRQCTTLRQWAAGIGGLTDTTDGLEALEKLLAGSIASRPQTPRLRIEIGQFIGTVVIENLPTVRWRLLPNGYPVIHLAENSDLDVMSIARVRLSTGIPDLGTILPYAKGLAG